MMKKSEINVVFIHKDSKFPVAYAAEHAAAEGFNTLVVGDEEWKLKGVKVFGLDRFSDGCVALSQQYIHQSKNKVHYERFCFERWIILRNFMRELGLKNVLYVDSDALIYDGVEELFDISGGKIFDTPYLNVFQNFNSLDPVVDEIMQAFSSFEENQKRWEFGLDKKAFYSDMLLFPQLIRKNPHVGLRWSRDMERLGFDSNINEPNGFDPFVDDSRGVKKIFRSNGGRYAIHSDHGEVRFKFIHFQGVAKALMKYYLSGDDDKYSSCWWPNPTNNIIKTVAGILEDRHV